VIPLPRRRRRAIFSAVREQRSESTLPLRGDDRNLLAGEPPNFEAAKGAFDHLITPAKLRFVRCHYPVPELAGDHALSLSGALARPLRVSLPELRALPPETITVVTECAGNGRHSFDPPVPGEPWRDGAVSVAQWTGVRLRLLLDRAGLSDAAVELVFTGADGGEYQRSLPREIAPDALLALEMNGAPIPPVFGGPLRLVVPDWYGMASVKWLSRIEAVTTPFSGRYQTENYVYGKGAPVTRVRIKSMFTSLPEELREGAPARLTGLAWGGQGVARVEVSAGGAWEEARLVGPELPYAWRRFELHWTPPAAGRYLLRCRATDASGGTQPETPQWNERGYGANGVQRRSLIVR
jgi:DMSO/TMAO reductase YedYZ molybdopterin-dependent catalytic subunit